MVSPIFAIRLRNLCITMGANLAGFCIPADRPPGRFWPPGSRPQMCAISQSGALRHTATSERACPRAKTRQCKGRRNTSYSREVSRALLLCAQRVDPEPPHVACSVRPPMGCFREMVRQCRRVSYFQVFRGGEIFAYYPGPSRFRRPGFTHAIASGHA
jgi:hypothetical protein